MSKVLMKSFLTLTLAAAMIFTAGNAAKLNAAEHQVDIVDFTYQPADLTINVGDMVTWTNIDMIEHTSTSDDGVWDSGLLSHGESFTFTFDTEGTYPYHCTPHPFMTGVITVSGGQMGCCNVDMEPDNSPVEVPPGGSFGLTGFVGNSCEDMITTDVWYGVVYSGMFFEQGKVLNIPLNPGQTLSAHLNQAVPNFAPQGTYDYVAYCGEYDDMPEDSASFEFTVTGARMVNGADEWNLEGGFDQNSSVPQELGLMENYPNPFNAQTNITFELPSDSDVSLEIYNIIGQRVAELVDGNLSAGRHTVSWDASDAASGVYFYKLTAGEKVVTKKMNLLK